MNFISQLEPQSIIDNFISNPPEGFQAGLTKENIPFFITQYDLLTTLDQALLKKISPYLKWITLPKPNTFFIGTTASEYALLPTNSDPDDMAGTIKNNYSHQYQLTIIKDIPANSPLLAERHVQYFNTFINTLKNHRFIEIEGQALCFVPVDYKNIEEYLLRFSRSRRKDFKRKLRSLAKIDINIIKSGDDLFFNEAVIDHYYQLYINVYNQSEIKMDKLTKSFFRQLLQDKIYPAQIITYSNDNRLIGYNVCYIYNNMLIDKYIGLSYPLSLEFNLYFVSWFYNLEYALANGLDFYVSGWTDQEIKQTLGAQFTFTKHLVYAKNPIFRFFIKKASKFF